MTERELVSGEALRGQRGRREDGATRSAKRRAAAWLLGTALALSLGCQSGPKFEGGVVDGPKHAPALEGINWNGERFRLADHEGQVAVLFFGYTFCPDVCPFTLVKMKQIYADLGERSKDLAVVFVSVDPHRDSLQKLASYVPGFDRRFYGVRLEFDELDQVIDDFGITVQYGQPKDGPGTDSFYYVDHTGTYFLLDKQGRIRVQHPPNAKVEELLPDIKVLLDE